MSALRGFSILACGAQTGHRRTFKVASDNDCCSDIAAARSAGHGRRVSDRGRALPSLSRSNGCFLLWRVRALDPLRPVKYSA